MLIEQEQERLGQEKAGYGVQFDIWIEIIQVFDMQILDIRFKQFICLPNAYFSMYPQYMQQLK